MDVDKVPSIIDRRSSVILPTKKAKELVESTYEEYDKVMRILGEKMGDNDFSSLLKLLEQANIILLEEKNNG